MTQTIDVLISKAHKYLQTMSTFMVDQEVANREIIKKGSSNPNFQRDLAHMSHNLSEAPYLLAHHYLEGVEFGPNDIQGLIDATGEFTHYDDDTFDEYGVFLSVMVSDVLGREGELTLRTPTETVHVPEHYEWLGRESSFPWGKNDLREYLRQSNLISRLGSRLTSGRLTVKGNVGSFFGYQNRGADIVLDGECGWRAGYGMVGGSMTVNGTAGHDLALYATGGAFVVNGQIRSMEEAKRHLITHNPPSQPIEGITQRQLAILLTVIVGSGVLENRKY